MCFTVFLIAERCGPTLLPVARASPEFKATVVSAAGPANGTCSRSSAVPSDATSLMPDINRVFNNIKLTTAG
ncbi:hypothetical protein GCM10009734_97580 [Nonomuraea bangladeshensis]